MSERRAVKVLNQLNENILIIGFVATIMVLFIQVIARTFFGTAYGWVEEVARYLFIFFILGGTAQAFKHGLFISVDVVGGFLPKRGKLILDIVAYVLTIIFFVYVAYLGLKLFLSSGGQLTPALEFEIRYVYLTFPIFFLQITFFALTKLIASLKELISSNRVEN
jgi:C4-dicarboxylate transporter DctQ subunit